MPALGVAQERGTLLNWLKAEGQSVTKGEPLMEVETDKARVEIEAPASGILPNVTASAGDEIPVGNRIAVILAPGEVGTSTAPAPQPRIESGADSRPEPSTHNSESKREAEPNSPISPFDKGRSKGDFATRILASPAAKRIAIEKGIDLASLKGSGPGGSVLAEDVLRSATSQAAAPGESPKIKETIQLTPMRRIVGERM